MNEFVEVGYGEFTLRVPAILANAWKHLVRERVEQPRVERLRLAVQQATDEGRLADAADLSTTLWFVLDRVEPGSGTRQRAKCDTRGHQRADARRHAVTAG